MPLMSSSIVVDSILQCNETVPILGYRLLDFVHGRQSDGWFHYMD